MNGHTLEGHQGAACRISRLRQESEILMQGIAFLESQVQALAVSVNDFEKVLSAEEVPVMGIPFALDECFCDACVVLSLAHQYVRENVLSSKRIVRRCLTTWWLALP